MNLAYRPAPPLFTPEHADRIAAALTDAQRNAIALTLQDLSGWATLYGREQVYDARSGIRLPEAIREVGGYDRTPRMGLPPDWVDLFISAGWLRLVSLGNGLTVWLPSAGGRVCSGLLGLIRFLGEGGFLDGGPPFSVATPDTVCYDEGMNDTACPTETTTTREFNIPAYMRDQAQAKVTKVNRRITKLGLTPYVVTFVDGPMKPHYDESDFYTTVDGVPHTRTPFGLVPCPVIDWEATVDVTITGELPHLGDWNPIAVLTRDVDGPPTDGPTPVITRVFPGLPAEPDLTQFRGTNPVCDHCHTVRVRTDTFVVQHRVTGEMKQVGRNCLTAYTGIELRLPSWLYSDGIDDMDEWSSTGAGGGEPYLTVAGVLETTVQVAAQFGWVSRQMESDSYGTKTATSIIVLAVMRGRTQADQELRNSLTGTPDKTTVAKVLAHAATLMSEGTEYATNLATLAAGEWVSVRNVPLLCSAYSAWYRAETARVERAARPESHWQGQIKEKLQDLTVTVTHTSLQKGYYGGTVTYSTLIGMIDEVGNRFKWWATGTWTDLAPGTVLTLNGTVKGHDEYKGQEETVLTRCKVTSETVPQIEEV